MTSVSRQSLANKWGTRRSAAWGSALASSAVGKGSPRWSSQHSKPCAIDAISQHVLRHGRRDNDKLFSADEETLGDGIGWSLSPTSRGKQGGQMRDGGGLAFKHVLDDAALDELLIIRGHEENHYCFCGQREKEEMEMEKKRGRRQNS